MIYTLTIIGLSKSKSARATCDYYIRQVNNGYMTIDVVRQLIRNCHNRTIANRMAIRLGRMIRNGKINI